MVISGGDAFGIGTGNRTGGAVTINSGIGSGGAGTNADGDLTIKRGSNTFISALSTGTNYTRTKSLAYLTETDNATTIIDWTAGNKQKKTLGANTTLTFTAPSTSFTTLSLRIIQDGTGGRTLTLPGTVVNAPNIDTTAGAVTILNFWYDGTNYFGSGGVSSIADGSVTLAKLANGTALSVVGNATNSSAVHTDIASTTDGDVLRRSGTTLGFGAPNFAAQSITTTGDINLGTNPADTGIIRLANNRTIRFRNAANSANKDALTINSSDNLVLGTLTDTCLVLDDADGYWTAKRDGYTVINATPLGMDIGDTTIPMVEITQFGTRDILALCYGATLTTTQIPSGDQGCLLR